LRAGKCGLALGLAHRFPRAVDELLVGELLVLIVTTVRKVARVKTRNPNAHGAIVELQVRRVARVNRRARLPLFERERRRRVAQVIRLLRQLADRGHQVYALIVPGGKDG
jgi:hypothetical protein